MIVHIVAATPNGVIGGDNKLLWSLPKDLQNFKKLTLGHRIFMGKNTFLSILQYAKGRPILPGRQIVVVSKNVTNSQKLIDTHGVCPNISFWPKPVVDAITITDPESLIIVGGEQLYSAYEPDLIYYTEVELDVEGDAHYPIDLSQYKLISCSAYDFLSSVKYRFKVYKKIQKIT